MSTIVVAGAVMGMVAELQQRATRGESLVDLTEAALRSLNDPVALAAEPTDAETALSALRSEWQEMDATARAAWSRYPYSEASGAHGVRPDPRAMQLFGTLSYVEKAGMYRPSELEGMLRREEAPPAWVTREALRLRMLLVCLTRLVDDLDTGTISPLTFGEAVNDLTQRFERATIAAPRSSTTHEL